MTSITLRNAGTQAAQRQKVNTVKSGANRISIFKTVMGNVHYVNISVRITHCCISVIPSYILLILFMNFICKILLCKKES